MEYNILGILVKETTAAGEKLQRLFSDYGCIIRTRIGLNRDEIEGRIIIIDLHGDQTQINSLLENLNKIEGIEYKYMTL
ncbi:MAG: hypothetical protein LBQ22_01315 [Bacteroidales bacterium]|jgi:hypothetical protein|nr:hypothetical protein [Bacteroidales bacterium]